MGMLLPTYRRIYEIRFLSKLVKHMVVALIRSNMDSMILVTLFSQPTKLYTQ